MRQNQNESSHVPGSISQDFPDYQGLKWLDALVLPTEPQAWLDGTKQGIRQRKTGLTKTKLAVKQLLKKHEWVWPQRPIIFISDLHADADALLNSLVSSGGIKKTGPDNHQFKLTHQGKKSLFIFGGDFFDKGPSNLQLLRVLHQFIKTGARVRLLAGNHDIRILFGMRSAGHTDDPRNGHFFVRMGAKAIPFLREIRDTYLTDVDALKDIPSDEQCHQFLYPSERWWKQFPDLASWVMPAVAIEREMTKIEYKVSRFEGLCKKAGLTLREAYAAALKWQELFLSKHGEFHWFFKRMRLVHRKGSFLFLHAGVDDRIADMLVDHGAGYLNDIFKQQMFGSPFEFYYGPVANVIRTKYRIVDMPLTRVGSQQAHLAGIHAIVHGHRNLHRGQRIALRKSILHFECDVTLDRCSRSKEGLEGIGAGATIIHPGGHILGISSDYKKIKVFDPKAILADGQIVDK